MGEINRMRNCNFSMRLREHEDALLDAKKDEFGMSKSEYLRNIILFAAAGERPRYSSEFAHLMFQELNNIGNSVNEIAHAVNSRRAVIPADLQAMTDHYMKLFTVYDKFVRDKVKNPY